LVQGVIDALKTLYLAEVSIMGGIVENTRFKLPAEVLEKKNLRA
jgi:hypothetical protein